MLLYCRICQDGLWWFVLQVGLQEVQVVVFLFFEFRDLDSYRFIDRAFFQVW